METVNATAALPKIQSLSELRNAISEAFQLYRAGINSNLFVRNGHIIDLCVAYYESRFPNPPTYWKARDRERMEQVAFLRLLNEPDEDDNIALNNILRYVASGYPELKDELDFALQFGIGSYPLWDVNYGVTKTLTRKARSMVGIAAWEVTQEYGGPEEGGWWYEAGFPLCYIPFGNISHEETVHYYPLTDRAAEDRGYDFLAENIVNVDGLESLRANIPPAMTAEVRAWEERLATVYSLPSEQQHRKLPSLYPTFLRVQLTFDGKMPESFPKVTPRYE